MRRRKDTEQFVNVVNVFDPIWIRVDYQERRRHSCKRHETTTDGVNNKDFFLAWFYTGIILKLVN